MEETTIWNSYAVHGDVTELNRIIKLDKEDIVATLSVGLENWVVTGEADSLQDAFHYAMESLPCDIKDVRQLLVEFCYGKEIHVKMSDFAKITDVLSNSDKEMSVMWSIVADDSLGSSFKVILVASVCDNAKSD